MDHLNRQDRDRILRAALRKALRRARRNRDDERRALVERILNDEMGFTSLVPAVEFEAFLPGTLEKERDSVAGGSVLTFLRWIVENPQKLMVLIQEIVSLLDTDQPEQPDVR